jgi:CheY-like chemotaxis protein
MGSKLELVVGPSQARRERGNSGPSAAAPARPRILVIDGYRALADVIHELLTIDGWTVAKAYDGAEGLRLAQSIRPGVVFCDLQLKGRPDAYEVASALRGGFAPGPVHVVGLTTADLSECPQIHHGHGLRSPAAKAHRYRTDRSPSRGRCDDRQFL